MPVMALTASLAGIAIAVVSWCSTANEEMNEEKKRATAASLVALLDGGGQAR